MKTRSYVVGTVAVLLTTLGTTGAALAQDPPSRVARLNWLTGNVSFQPAGMDEWAGATLNYPLTTGDHIYADTASRAEMHVGPNAFRLDGQSNFGFLNLDDRTVQARFTEGSLEIRVRRLEDSDLYEIDTPQGAVTLLRTGDYRIDTDPGRNATMITVRSGEAEVSFNGQTAVLHPRETAYFADGAAPDIRPANSRDDFDGFTADRNAREDRVPVPVHVSDAMAGYEDLDQYGAWQETPDYGWAWRPRVAAGWAPYHEGRWAWVEPWGWTWVDEAPWGFAPFHYGRWAFAGGVWIWVPGTVVARPVYAPALVAFVGGPRFGLSLSIGGGGGAVAWFALGPREPFYPGYSVSNRYIQQVNITHVTNINVTNINVTNVRYANQQVPGAVIAMPQQGFAGARRVRDAGVAVQPGQLAQAQVIGAAPGIAPRRESMMGAQTNRVAAAPPQAVMARQVIAKAPPPAAPIAFAARQQMIQQNQGRPLAPDQVTQLRQQQPGAVVNGAPIRAFTSPAPASVARPAFDRPAQIASPAGTPVQRAAPAMDRPVQRLDSRPPGARPGAAIAAPAAQAPAVRTPAPQPVPQPAARVPEAVRPQPETRRENTPPVRETRPEPASVRAAPAERPVPKHEPKKEEKEKEKK